MKHFAKLLSKNLKSNVYAHNVYVIVSYVTSLLMLFFLDGFLTRLACQ